MHRKCQRLLLARGVLPAWGAPARPGLPPEGETGKGEIQSPLLPQAFQPLWGDRISLQLEGHFFVATTVPLCGSYIES